MYKIEDADDIPNPILDTQKKPTVVNVSVEKTYTYNKIIIALILMVLIAIYVKHIRKTSS
jgi:hypothetical protein